MIIKSEYLRYYDMLNLAIIPIFGSENNDFNDKYSCDYYASL